MQTRTITIAVSLPLTGQEDREELRHFLHASFDDLKRWGKSDTPTATLLELYADFDLIATAWQRHGHNLDT